MTFHPKALLVTVSVAVLLFLATDVRWGIAAAAATVVLDWFSFAGVLGTHRR